MQEFLDWLNSLNKPRLPSTAEQLQNAKDLDLSDCNLTNEHISFIIHHCRNLPNLKGINLANNDIICLPDEFGSLHIEKLGLCNNYHLYNIRAVESLSNLKHLYLNGSHTVELPHFSHSLKELHLQNTHLPSLTPILEATNLEVLDICRNRYVDNIDEIQNLTNLKRIVFDKDIAIPNWLQNDDWEYIEQLIDCYYEVYVFTRRQQ